MAPGGHAWSTCIVTALIGTKGEVEGVEFIKPEDIEKEPERVIREMIGAWVFEPATLRDEPVAVRYHLVLHHCPYRARRPLDEGPWQPVFNAQMAAREDLDARMQGARRRRARPSAIIEDHRGECRNPLSPYGLRWPPGSGRDIELRSREIF